MGFITPSHVWEETDSEVTVLVEVKGVPRSSFDVFASSAFLKVNAPPYLFSCDLEGDIADALIDDATMTGWEPEHIDIDATVSTAEAEVDLDDSVL